MKDNRLEQRIQHSLNAELSGLNTTSWPPMVIESIPTKVERSTG